MNIDSPGTPLALPLAARKRVRAVHFAQGAKMSKVRVRTLFAVITIVLLGVAQNLPAQFRGPRDPGVRGGAPGAGSMLAGLTADEQEMFRDGRVDFNEAEEVGDGLG